MTYFLIITFFIIFIISVYLLNPKNEKKKFFFFLVLISSLSFTTYFFIGNINSFFFEMEIENEIQYLIKNPEQLSQTDPQKIIFYLESKLRENPNDLEGWKLLARTCLMTGHNQKAELHYTNALKHFPSNDSILFEYAVLKKNTNQINSALKLLNKADILNTKNINLISLFFDLLVTTKNSDILSIHVQGGEKYKDCIKLKELDKMKKTAFLINTSRGPIVNEDDLIIALSTNVIAGAGIDVYEKEPLPSDHKLRFIPNALLLPHIGYVTAENYSIFYAQMFENLESCVSGKPIRVIN